MPRIYSLKRQSLSENDRLELAKLLIKAGYTVRVGSEKNEKSTVNRYFVEYEDKTRM